MKNRYQNCIECYLCVQMLSCHGSNYCVYKSQRKICVCRFLSPRLYKSYQKPKIAKEKELFIKSSVRSIFLVTKIDSTMKLLVLVACAFVSASSSRLGGIDQISQLQTNGRIWGGRLANEGEIPYQVEVSIVSNQGAQSWCGGSIVSSNFVLSAAQCYTGNPTARVSGGRVDRANPLFVIAVAVIRNHPLFNVSQRNSKNI